MALAGRLGRSRDGGARSAQGGFLEGFIAFVGLVG